MMNLNSALPVAVFLTVVFTELAYAQSQDCRDILIIWISFNESDSQPSFSDTNYYKTIIRSRPYSIDILDDGSTSLPFNASFVIGYNSSFGTYVQMRSAIDRDGPTASVEDDLTIFQYRIQCMEEENQITSFGLLRIIIEDVNDNPPLFNDIQYSFEVHELTSPSTIVDGGVSTVDIDEGANAAVNYYLYSMPGAMFNGTGVFDINEFTGQISIKKRVDFDSMYHAVGGDASRVMYEYTIFAVDGGYFAQTSTAMVAISITDADDLDPTFYYPSCPGSSDLACHTAAYDSYIFSNDSSGSILTIFPVPRGRDADGEVDILAYDRDSLNASIKCIIGQVITSGMDLKSYFDVWTSPVDNTGVYKCTVYHLPDKPISRETHPIVQLSLQAQEETFNRRSAFATLRIEVIDEVQAPPSSTPVPYEGQLISSPKFATGYVNENELIGSLVSADINLMTDLWFLFLYVDATLFQNNSTFTDVQISQYPASPFTVTENHFIEVSEPTLDFETRQSYEFVIFITAYPVSVKTATVSVTIILLDLNDNAPVFDSRHNFEAEIKEADYSLRNEPIFVFTVTDADGSAENNEVTFDLVSVRPADGFNKFRLGTGGVLLVTGNVVAQDTYNFVVAATDSGDPSLSSDIDFEVRVIKADTSSDDGLDTGVLVGIAVASVLVIALVIILITCYYACRRRREKNQGRTEADQHGRRDPQRNQELSNVIEANTVYTGKEHPYVYADGFIHKDSSDPNKAKFAHDNTGRRQDDEEIYHYINESEVADTATQSNDAPENSYTQPTDFPPEDDPSYLTPALPKRDESADDPTYLQPMGTSMGNGTDSASYIQPDETAMKSPKNSRENSYLHPTGTDSAYELDTTDNTRYQMPTESTGENGETVAEDKTPDNQSTSSDKSHSKTYYDTLVVDDPSYSNLDGDHSEYKWINKEDQISRL